MKKISAFIILVALSACMPQSEVTRAKMAKTHGSEMLTGAKDAGTHKHGEMKEMPECCKKMMAEGEECRCKHKEEMGDCCQKGEKTGKDYPMCEHGQSKKPSTLPFTGPTPEDHDHH